MLQRLLDQFGDRPARQRAQVVELARLLVIESGVDAHGDDPGFRLSVKPFGEPHTNATGHLKTETEEAGGPGAAALVPRHSGWRRSSASATRLTALPSASLSACGGARQTACRGQPRHEIKAQPRYRISHELPVAGAGLPANACRWGRVAPIAERTKMSDTVTHERDGIHPAGATLCQGPWGRQPRGRKARQGGAM